MKNRITLLGLGNILLQDEGIGVHVVQAIKDRYSLSPDVELVDGGTMGLDLLPIFQDSRKVLIIDAVDFGKPPGHVGTIEGKNIPSVLSAKLSVHHIGLSDVLFASTLMNDIPPEVCLIGIQPKNLDVGLDMTPEVRENFDTLVSMAIKKLADWNVECVLQSPLRSSK